MAKIKKEKGEKTMKKIKDLLETREISLSKLANEIGTTRQTLNNISSGKSKASILTIKKICAYYDVDYKDYIEE